MKNRKKIAITGGTGFIGQYFLKRCCMDCEMKVLTSRADVSALFLHSNIEYVRGAYDVDGFQSLMRGCDAVIHLGAQRPVGKNKNVMQDYYQNIVSSELLFQTAEQLGIHNIVNVSSGSIYGKECELPAREDGETYPQNCYGIAKRCIEDLGQMYSRSGEMNIKSLRVARVFGVGERPEFMPAVFFEKCLKNEPLTLMGNVETSRDYIYVKDVARALEIAINHSGVSGVFNIGSGVEITNLELAEVYCEVLDNSAGCNVQHDPLATKTRMVMDVKRAREKLGFETEYSLREALADMKAECREVVK